MARSRRYFPWKIFGHFIFRSVLFWSLVLIGAGFSLRFYVFKTFLEETSVSVALGEFDDYLAQMGVVIFLLMLAFTLWAGRYYFQPLGRLLKRTRNLRRLRKPSPDDAIEDFSDEEPGEWTDLERAVERLNSDLRLKTEQLGREREELAALIGSVSSAILAIDLNELPLFFNSQFAHLFGVSNNQRNITLGEIFRSPEVLGAFRQVLRTGKSEVVSLVLHTSQHTLPRNFNLSVAALLDKENEAIYGAVGIFNDVTELKQAEQVRIEFVANASHELRTPLTSIKGYLDTVISDIKAGRASETGEFLEIISKNVDRMTHLVSDLLDLSAIESGRELDKSIVHTREITDSVLKQLEIKRAQKKIQIKTEFGAETLLADPRRLEQVLLNLVQNAIKYIQENGVVEVRWQMMPDATVSLHVKDNGPGIPSDHQARLFERFYRVDPGRSREQGGTGLGLSIVKHIMLKHGGSVQLQSRWGDGTEFICRFPSE